MLVSKTQNQWNKSVMWLNGREPAGIAGHWSEHREDLSTSLIPTHAWESTASTLNIYHHCYVHPWHFLCHSKTRYFPTLVHIAKLRHVWHCFLLILNHLLFVIKQLFPPFSASCLRWHCYSTCCNSQVPLQIEISLQTEISSRIRRTSSKFQK